MVAAERKHVDDKVHKIIALKKKVYVGNLTAYGTAAVCEADKNVQTRFLSGLWWHRQEFCGD